ncbi:hypothetical protein LN650_11405 [Klebsiella pneumoniae subsp. pneumoniae]|nr:hypothetical protein [Klebsiella pneumoniae subsp. pneumoniae]
MVTKEGDTFDCRQWQRVIAQPGKLMNRDSEIYNVTASHWTSILSSARASTISYDRMTLSRVERLTPECEKAWAKARATGPVSAPASTR